MRETPGALVLYLLTLILRLAAQCHFPDYMQTYGPGPSWFMHYQSGVTVNITVHQGRMLLTECRRGLYDGCHTYERHCKREYGNQKFLVKKILRRLPPFTYECIQFVLRSRSVVQMKSSFVDKDLTESLCSDTMLVLDMYPMISIEHAMESTACPFSGGYDFKMYTADDTTVAKCDDIFLPLRVESDCLSGEGMSFYFRRLDCVSDVIGRELHLEPTQLRCLANWHYRSYAFSVVKWDGEPNYWCIRVSFRHKIPHEMIIFFSGICATDPQSYDNSLILRHFVSHFVKGICDDEAPLCTYEQTCSTNARERCKLTCSLCQPEQEERPCTFQYMFHGDWHSLQDPTSTAIQIWNNTLTESGRAFNWNCVASTDARAIGRRVLKRVFPNGCFPRYMCLHLELPAKSVLRYRTGTQLQWPIESLETVCRNRYFDFKPETPQLSITRTSRPWLYYVSNKPTYVSCNLPWYIPKISPFIMYDSSNSEAHKGCLINSARSSEHILKLLYTHEKMIWRRHVFKCLASLKNIGENDLLITQNVEEGQYMCWTFVKGPHNVYIYIYNATDCGNGTYMQLIHTYPALVTLVIRGQESAACDFIEDEQRASILRRSEENVASIPNNCQRVPWGHLTTSVLLLVIFRLVL